MEDKVVVSKEFLENLKFYFEDTAHSFWMFAGFEPKNTSYIREKFNEILSQEIANNT